MSKEDAVFKAKLAEQAERYEDMVAYMKEIVAVWGESKGSRGARS
jgi:hypothetical protein